MASTYATSYEHTTTTSTVQTTSYSETHQTSGSGVIDPVYIKGIPGLLKLLEVVFALLGFLLVVSTSSVCLPLGANGWFCFVTMFAVITTILLYLLLLFKLQRRIFRCDCIFWPSVELYYYIGIVVLLFIADIIVSVFACTDQVKAGVAFGWFSFIVYCIDLGFAARVVMKSRTSSSSQQETVVTTNVRY